ncbi:MAG: hypothetical protein KJO05_08055 [Bacteroidia bacterium]|nr:hypothetical protein [Bacteroidia bacterium]NNF31493.1 hypothetical protein [Flavobacteriaceae bacterium]MBT8275568.1 hypothetical protein [Bacteroidia bacterium]NNJ82032.1 hypothetical protein [Flavobacteriaceae bacterium]NNK54072.1 hypothetical protein [Flavobacteriaceae bacterium]
MSLKNLTFVTFTLLFIVTSQAQKNYDSYNRLGLQAGFTLFDIETSDLTTKQTAGFMGGFTTRGSFYEGFDLIYGINFFSNNIEILAVSKGLENSIPIEEFLDYTINAVQINFLGSYNIVRHHFSLEFGPVLNVNGKMKLNNEDRYERYILDGDASGDASASGPIRAGDVQDISKVNFRVMGGATAGLENFRLWGQYQYGVTNMLKNLNDKGLGKTDFKGNSSTFIFGAVFFF